MKEQDYINVSTLTNLRRAYDCITAALCITTEEIDIQKEAIYAIGQLTEIYEKKVEDLT